MSYYNWRELFIALENWGLSDVLLPFLLIFTLVYAVLQKVQVLTEKKSVNVTIALVMGLSTVIPHATGRVAPQYDPVLIINKALPNVAIILVAIVMLLILVGVWGAKSDWDGANQLSGAIVILAVIAVVWIFGASANWWTGWGWFNSLFNTDAGAIVVMILVFGLVLYFITREETESKGDGMMKNFGNLFKKQ